MSESALPLVCICIPTYNAEKTVATTLRSILGQTYGNFVVQVVDNHSTDNTTAIVEGFTDPRVTLHRNDVNIGGEGNFNRCIELAVGKYTAIYHADDVYEPEMIAAQVAFLEAHPNAGAVFTQALLIDDAGNRIGEIRQPRELEAQGTLHRFPEVFRAILKHSNFLICPSVMASTKVYQDEIKCWRGELFGPSGDLDVWLRMLQRGPVGILPDATMRYRISTSQWSANVRLDTARAAFFSVIDYYLAQENVQRMVTADDLVNYARLERRDQVMRAVNAVLKDQPEQARAMCPDVFSPAALKAAVQTRRGLGVFLLGLFLKLMLALNLNSFAKTSLVYLKRVLHK